MTSVPADASSAPRMRRISATPGQIAAASLVAIFLPFFLVLPVATVIYVAFTERGTGAFTLVYVVGTAAALRLLPRGTWVHRGAAVSLVSTLALLGLTGRHLLPQLLVLLAALAWMAWQRRTLRRAAPVAPGHA